MTDLVAMNATMTTRILGAPAPPFVEGGYALRVVYTTGRVTGKRRATPLGVVQIDGAQHLVCPERGRDWVRNLAADPRCVLAPGDDERVAVEAPPATAAPVVAAYLDAMRAMPFALQSFPVTPDAGLDEITAHLDTIAVLRLDPATA